MKIKTKITQSPFHLRAFCILTMKGQLTRQFPFSFWNCQHSSTFFWLIPTLHYTCSILCFWERGTFIKEDGYTALIKHRGHASRETQTGRQKATGARALSLGSHLVSMCFVLLLLQTSIHSSVHTWPNVAALVQQSIENLCYTF